MKSQSLELVEEMNELERNQQKKMVEVKVNEYSLSMVHEEEWKTRKRSIQEDIEENENEMREINEEIKRIVQERIEKEKEGLAMRDRLDEVQQEIEKRRIEHRSVRRELKQMQEELIVNLDNQKELREKMEILEREVCIVCDMKRRYNE